MVTKSFDISNLFDKAIASKDGEAYSVLEKIHHHRIGVGVRIESRGQPSLFLDILVNLFPNSSQVDLPLLERELAFLNGMKARRYVLSHQGDGCVSCEIVVSKQHWISEYRAARSMVEKTFRTQ